MGQMDQAESGRRHAQLFLEEFSRAADGLYASRSDPVAKRLYSRALYNYLYTFYFDSKVRNRLSAWLRQAHVGDELRRIGDHMRTRIGGRKLEYLLRIIRNKTAAHPDVDLKSFRDSLGLPLTASEQAQYQTAVRELCALMGDLLTRLKTLEVTGDANPRPA